MPFRCVPYPALAFATGAVALVFFPLTAQDRFPLTAQDRFPLTAQDRFPLTAQDRFPLTAQDRTDLNLIHQIREQAFEHSQVMETAAMLTDRYGPRLAASPEFDEAADWALKRMKDWGLDSVHAESWGPFGRTWSLKKYSVEMVEPRYALLSALPLAWSAPTGKPVTAEVVIAPFSGSNLNPAKLEADFEKYKQEWRGKLKGKIVLFSKWHTSSLGVTPNLRRYSDAELADLAKAPEPPVSKIDIKPEEVRMPDDDREAAAYYASLPATVRKALSDRADAATNARNAWYSAEGVVAILSEDTRAHEGMVFAEQAGSRKVADALSPPKFRVTEEQYNRIARLIERKETVKLRVELDAAVGDRDVNAKNLVAELPGGAKKDEIVMIGAHFDSWHGATGATDNAAGSAVMMEAMRILSALHVKLDRTVRIVLWSGEEEGLLGSEAYVKEHFGDPDTMKITGQHAKLAAYFNLDNGSGKIRGVYLQGNDAARPFFDRVLPAFRDLGVTTVSIRNTGGTDHLSFDAVGLPGFQFIQDPLDYSSITHHSTVDTYDHLVRADLMQAAAVIAGVVATEANAPEMMPRKPLPPAQK